MITKPKYTPGPWRCDPEGKIWSESKTELICEKVCYPKVAEVASYLSQGDSGDEGHANANLIAAAPDLLEALKDLVSQIEDGSWNDILTGQAEDAIDKAEGRVK